MRAEASLVIPGFLGPEIFEQQERVEERGFPVSERPVEPDCGANDHLACWQHFHDRFCRWHAMALAFRRNKGAGTARIFQLRERIRTSMPVHMW